MENFFGLLKQEMFYGVSYEALKKKIEKYIDYYTTNELNKNWPA